MGEHHWVQHSVHVPIPAYAVIGGHDSDGTPIYVGRAFHEGDYLPAKVVPSKHAAYVSWQGEEHTKSHYEILVGQRYGWVPCFKGRVPANAVRTGGTISGEPLYVGRGHWEGSLTVGKIHPSHECLYIPYGGSEHRLDACEVLVHEQHVLPPQPVPPQQIREGYRWVPSTAHSGIPPNAVLGGHDSDGSVMYVGRAFHNGDMITAKVVPSKHAAYVPWRGQEISKDQFEILCGTNLVWRPCYDHAIPPNAVLSGRTALSQPVYVGRGHYESSLTVGKISSVHRALFIPFAGLERRLESYEILVEDNTDPGWSVLPQPQPYIAVCPPAPYPTAPTLPVATWIACGPSYTPPNPVHAGHDVDMAVIFVGRAFHDGNLLPAKVVPSRSCAYVSNGGHEIQKYQYEMLTGDGYHWEHARDGYVPPGALEGGHTVNGEPLYIGRAHYNGSLTLGKIQRSHNCMYFPFGGAERRTTTYEVLTASPTPSVYPTQAIKMSYS